MTATDCLGRLTHGILGFSTGRPARSGRASVVRPLLTIMDRRPGVPAAVCIAAACVLLAVRGRAETGAGAADVVATVDATPILRGELEALVRRLVAGAAAAEDGQRLAATAVEQLVDEQLLRAEVDRVGVAASEAEIAARLDTLQRQVAARGSRWDEFLADNGRDQESLQGRVTLEIGVSKLMKPKISGAALEAGFQQRRREIDGTRLRVSHVLLRPDLAVGDEAVERLVERAAAIRREILQGMLSFADAARRHSVAPSRSRGGDLGWIARQGPLGEAFNRQVYRLAKGDVSRPFITPYGVHLAQVTDVEPGTLGLAAIRPALEQILAAEAIRETVARLRAETAIEYAPGVPHFDPATPADSDQPRRILVNAAADPPSAAAPPAQP